MARDLPFGKGERPTNFSSIPSHLFDRRPTHGILTTMATQSAISRNGLLFLPEQGGSSGGGSPKQQSTGTSASSLRTMTLSPSKSDGDETYLLSVRPWFRSRPSTATNGPGIAVLPSEEYCKGQAVWLEVACAPGSLEKCSELFSEGSVLVDERTGDTFLVEPVEKGSREVPHEGVVHRGIVHTLDRSSGGGSLGLAITIPGGQPSKPPSPSVEDLCARLNEQMERMFPGSSSEGDRG